MQITKEIAEQHAVQAYSDSEIKINSVIYQLSLIVNREEIISAWDIRSIHNLEENLAPILQLNPEVIIIGHKEIGIQASGLVYQKLSQLRIGLECMSIGAACRTYNVLLSEQRSVALGIIF